MPGKLLEREEYVEQEYFFRVYRERLQQNVPSQEILQTIHEEILATTRLPLAIDFLRTEILHSGRISDGMARLSHYFTPFQAFVIQRAEDDESRFEQLTALRILESEAHYRAKKAVPAGLFVYQFECIARNRLGYADGLRAMSLDPLYDSRWSDWIQRLSQELGACELADIVYRASAHFQSRRTTQRTATETSAELPASEPAHPLALFGNQEGRIAKANIGRDPLYFFAALQRQLDYPAIPRAPRNDDYEKLPPHLEARLNKIEQKIKLVEMEQKGGIDLTRFYRGDETPQSLTPGMLPPGISDVPP
ncbi:MAG: hypothetical protein JNL58_06310 [Planctomyces sp.]|nr:hypothetical protein [Planctomyces sp.]